jgi:hypothetical protein
MSYADAYDGYLTAQRQTRFLTDDDLPHPDPPAPPARAGRKRKE